MVSKKYKGEVPYFIINGYDFKIDTDAVSESELNLIKNRMFVSNKAWGYNDIQWTNFSGENIDLTVYSRRSDKYTGDKAQPEDGGISDFYETERTPHAVLKYWSQNFVVCTVKTNLQSFENGNYVIDTFKQSSPTFDFIVTDMTLVQYEQPSEVNQSYYSPVNYDVNTALLNAGISEVRELKLHSQSCDCNQYTPALQCTATAQEDVKVIQKYLMDWGYFPNYTKDTGNINPNGKYCYTTTVAVMKFQKDMGIPVSGDFTDETRTAFIKKISNW